MGFFALVIRRGGEHSDFDYWLGRLPVVGAEPRVVWSIHSHDGNCSDDLDLVNVGTGRTIGLFTGDFGG